ncbi:hypothetical protein ACLOJK_006700, partial [Asimina triloba]
QSRQHCSDDDVLNAALGRSLAWAAVMAPRPRRHCCRHEEEGVKGGSGGAGGRTKRQLVVFVGAGGAMPLRADDAGRSYRAEATVDRRPAIGTVAGGATVAGRGHRDDTRPATGPTTHRQSNTRYINFYRNLGTTSLVNRRGRYEL